MSNNAGQDLALEQTREHLDQLTKPPGSLGRLEDLAARLGAIQRTIHPLVQPRRLVIFAADHGVVESGVSAWPSEVTRLMVENIRSGRAASSVLANVTRTELALVNVGTNLPVDESAGEVVEDRCMSAGMVDQCEAGQSLPVPSEEGAAAAAESESESESECKSRLVAVPTVDGKVKPRLRVAYREKLIRRGTRDLSLEAALNEEEFMAAFLVGEEEARRAAQDQVRVVAAGEMGIGNSTAAACLAMLLADVPESRAVGRGAGADDATLERKRQAVRRAVQRARGRGYGPGTIAEISEVAGLELVAMAGFFREAHRQNLTIVLDGYIASAAALIAQRISPNVSESMIAAHRSAEPGHADVLHQLRLEPFLDWNMRLGEGTGALMLMPMLDAAAAILSDMATFADVGLTERVSE